MNVRGVYSDKDTGQPLHPLGRVIHQQVEGGKHHSCTNLNYFMLVIRLDKTLSLTSLRKLLTAE